MRRINKKDKGFTIIELVFATAVFSTILLVCLAALIQIGKMYYKGVTTTQTQEAARAIMDDISQSIQFSGSGMKIPTYVAASSDVPASESSLGFFCVGNTRYTYAIDRMVESTNNQPQKQQLHGLWADEPGVCAASSTVGPADLLSAQPSNASYKGRELLGEHMRLTKISLNPVDSAGSVWVVKLQVAYGDEDLLVVDPTDTSRKLCKYGQSGTEFCATSEISSVIKRRINVL